MTKRLASFLYKLFVKTNNMVKVKINLLGVEVPVTMEGADYHVDWNENFIKVRCGTHERYYSTTQVSDIEVEKD